MAGIIFVRGANVGKTNRFKPAAVASAMNDLDVVSIGAAGTFVFAGKTSVEAVRKRLAAELPFTAPLIAVNPRALREALDLENDIEPPPGGRRFATALEKVPPKVPSLPLDAPRAAPWAVQVHALRGNLAVGVRRPVSEAGVYPNEVVEKAFGVAATTRDWPTLEKVAAVLAGA
ncbi:MAG: hypothetical protein ACYDDF_01355 [Thermoplasmatota archaeon]